MIGRKLLRFSPIALVLVAAACGGGGGTKTVTVTETRTVTRTVIDTEFRLYFLRDGKVQPVQRGDFVPLAQDQTLAAATAALNQLTGSTQTIEEKIGLTSKLAKPDRWTLHHVDGELQVTGPPQPRGGLAQLVYTLTQFPDVKAVEFEGKRYTRADLEDATPLILVESPLPFQKVTSPLHATGTANTFEATFNYDLVGPDGKVIAHHFVTATSGSGTRGTFDFTVPFTVSQSGQGKLVVYELSAKDGSRIHQVEIPLRLEP